MSVKARRPDLSQMTCGPTEEGACYSDLGSGPRLFQEKRGLLLPFLLACDPGTPAVWCVRGVEYSNDKFTKNFANFFWLVLQRSIAYTARMSLPGKTIGEIGELRFCANAMERGLVVSQPFGDNAPYDAITEIDGVIRRVQIKSSNFWDRKGRHESSRYYGFFLTKGMGRGKPYSFGDYDILAAYIIPEDATYLIPFEELVGKKKLLINLNDGTKYSKFRESWDLLEID